MKVVEEKVDKYVNLLVDTPIISRTIYLYVKKKTGSEDRSKRRVALERFGNEYDGKKHLPR